MEKFLESIQTEIGLIYAFNVINGIKYYFVQTKNKAIRIISKKVLKEELKEEFPF